MDIVYLAGIEETLKRPVIGEENKRLVKILCTNQKALLKIYSRELVELIFMIFIPDLVYSERPQRFKKDSFFIYHHRRCRLLISKKVGGKFIWQRAIRIVRKLAANNLLLPLQPSCLSPNEGRELFKTAPAFIKPFILSSLAAPSLPHRLSEYLGKGTVRRKIPTGLSGLVHHLS